MELDPEGSYFMPVGFGQKRPHAAGVFESVWTLMTAYETDKDAMANLLPSPFEPADVPIVTVSYQKLRRVNFLAGGGYNLMSVDLAAHFDGPEEQLHGDFSLVIWENDAIPIIRGRELLGLPKVAGDIPDPLIHDNEWRVHVSDGGRPLIEMHVTQLGELGPGAVAELNAPSDRHLFGWKYIPNISGVGAAISRPVSVGIDTQVTAAWDARGRVGYGDVEWATNPESTDMVAGLRTLRVKDYVRSLITEGSMTITRARHRVLADLTHGVLERPSPQPGTESCAHCVGDCAAHSPHDVRRFLEHGASRVTYCGPGSEVPPDLVSHIEHSLLSRDFSAADVDQACAEAAERRFACVLVYPGWVGRAVGNLRGSKTKVAAAIGFPYGALPSDVKAMEARRALRDGAREIDMVISLGALKSGDLAAVREDIARVSDACREVGAINKVTVEAPLLTDEQLIVATSLAREGGADYVKTSTGFSGRAGRLRDVLIIGETIARLGVGTPAGRSTTVAQGSGLAQSEIAAAVGIELVRRRR